MWINRSKYNKTLPGSKRSFRFENDPIEYLRNTLPQNSVIIDFLNNNMSAYEPHSEIHKIASN